MRHYLIATLGACAALTTAAHAAPASMLNTPAPVESESGQPSGGRMAWLTKWFRGDSQPAVPQFTQQATAPPPATYQAPPSQRSALSPAQAIAAPAGKAPASTPLASAPPSQPLASQPIGSAADCKTLRTRGHEKDRAGELTEAEGLYRQAIGADPTSAAAVNDLALCLARQGKLEPSAAVFRQAIMMRPDKQLYRNNIATVLVELGQAEEALAHLKTVYRPAASHHNLGQLLARAGKTDDAVAQFREALALEPSLEPARNALAGLTPQPATTLAAAPPVTPVTPDYSASGADLLNPPAMAEATPTQVASAAAAAPITPYPAEPEDDQQAGVPSFPRLLPPVLDR